MILGLACFRQCLWRRNLGEEWSAPVDEVHEYVHLDGRVTAQVADRRQPRQWDQAACLVVAAPANVTSCWPSSRLTHPHSHATGPRARAARPPASHRGSRRNASTSCPARCSRRCPRPGGRRPCTACRTHAEYAVLYNGGSSCRSTMTALGPRARPPARRTRTQAVPQQRGPDHLGGVSPTRRAPARQHYLGAPTA